MVDFLVSGPKDARLFLQVGQIPSLKLKKRQDEKEGDGEDRIFSESVDNPIRRRPEKGVIKPSMCKIRTNKSRLRNL